MKKKSLLQKARSYKLRNTGGRPASKELPERMNLAIAWLKGDVTGTQVGHALGKGGYAGSMIYTALTLGLREAYRKGILKLKKQ